VYSDYFAIERAARDQRNDRAAWAENERRLALLARAPSPLTSLRRHLLAAREALAWRHPAERAIVDSQHRVRPST
jgi:hypothetical protein